MNFIKKTVVVFFVLFSISAEVLAFDTKAKHALLIDAETNTVLYQKNANVKMAPSSMSKLMTIYVVFSKLKDGSLKLDDRIMVSKNAWSKPGSKMFLPLNEQVTVENLIKGAAIQSGNDACIALAEGVAGSEETFAMRMNTVAKQIGLTNSHFVNATGWPHKNHYMSAKDLATLSQRLISDFPEYYGYFSERNFFYNNIKQDNRNVLLNQNIGVDGLKTGHTDAAGFGMAASAQQNGRRLIAVVNGLKSEQERANETQKLLQYGFLNFTNVKIAKANETIAQAQTWLGKEETVSLVCSSDLVFTVPVDHKNQVKAVLNYNNKIEAPVMGNTKVGTVEIYIPEQNVMIFDINTKNDVNKAGFVRGIYLKGKSWIEKKLSSQIHEGHKNITLQAN
jgi:serine-type D-Ala-D-Ala carboxypeptidase (penicillin-binding protein 5/6)